MSLFGKKTVKPFKPAAAVTPPVGTPPAPPESMSKPTAPTRGRKRITQRLVLGGKGVETGEISIGSGLKIPGAPDPVVSQIIPSGGLAGTVDIPVSSLLGYIPAEFVVQNHEILYQSPVAQDLVQIPLSVVLPLLPSGKIEILAHELHGYMPEGVMKNAEELGDYAYSPVSLPLPEVIDRIPGDLLTLRSDQKPVDETVTSMDEPFSAEMLAAAAQEAQELQGAGEDVGGLTEEAGESPFEVDPAATQAASLEESESPSAGQDSSAYDLPEESGETSFQPEVSPSVAAEAGDLSFTQSDEYKAFLEQQGAEPDPGSGEAELEEAVAETSEVVEGFALDEDYSDADVTKVIPRARTEAFEEMSQEESFDPSQGADDENPLFAPTRIMSKDKPKAPAPIQEKPPAFKPPEAPRKESATASPNRKNPPFSFKLPAPIKPPVIPDEGANEPELEDQDAGEVSESYQISVGLAELLGIRPIKAPTLKDIVHQINTWPGMKGCIVGGKDGLRISSEVDDDNFANSISAFAPKLISRISDLFRDLGFEDVEELHTPVRDSSVYIFRKEDLYLIVLFEDTSFPDSYRTLIKQVLLEIGAAG